MKKIIAAVASTSAWLMAALATFAPQGARAADHYFYKATGTGSGK